MYTTRKVLGFRWEAVGKIVTNYILIRTEIVSSNVAVEIIEKLLIMRAECFGVYIWSFMCVLSSNALISLSASYLNRKPQ